MSKEETIDVLMAGYLSKDAALDDFNAVQASGADLIGLVIIDKDLEGNVSIDRRGPRGRGPGPRSSAGSA